MQAIEASKSLVDKVYDAILEAISDGTLVPGQRLNQIELANRLNVSRQPLNSALVRLKADGFVVSTGRRGVVVARLDQDLFDAIYEYRTAVDPLAVELATARIDNKAISNARAIIDQGKHMVAMGNAPGAVQADADFHAWIYKLSDNSIIESTRGCK